MCFHIKGYISRCREGAFKKLFFKAASDAEDNDVMKPYNLVVYLNFIGLDGWKIR